MGSDPIIKMVFGPQGWKVNLARQMRDHHGASANWLAKRMGLNSGAYLRKLLTQG